MKKSKIASFLLVVLRVILFGGIICLFFLPALYNLFLITGAKLFFDNSILYQIAFFTCYIISLVIIFVLINILKEVYQGSPFKKETEINLKRIAILFMTLAIIVGIKTIFLPTILSAAVVLMTFIASLSFYVLSQLFKMALEYKHEIDYTV